MRTSGEPELRGGDEALEHGLEAQRAVGDFTHVEDLEMFAEAHRERKLRMRTEAGGVSFALPVIYEGRLLGMLCCSGISVQVLLSEELLQNLGVHLMLAANNSLHYTGAVTDGLTRLANKQYGLVRLEEAVFSAKRYNSALAVVMCDIDHFKRVNDTQGHPAGDAVLTEVARRIKACVRSDDTAVRYGGEEFMLIVPHVSADSLATLGEKVRRAVSAAPVSPGGGAKPIDVTISVGIAAYKANTESGQSLIVRADDALYRAKAKGRDCVEVDV